MAVSAHYLYDVNMGTASTMTPVSDFRVNHNMRETVLTAGGDIDAKYVAIGSQAPEISWTTPHIAAALGTVGISGLAIPASAQDFEAYFRKGTEGGVRAGATSHLKVTAAEGLIVPVSIRAGLVPPAQLAMSMAVTYNGTLEPIVYLASQNLAGTPTGISQSFVAGKVKFDSTQIDGVQDISINFGLGLDVISHMGEVWPRYVGIGTRRPSIAIRLKDPSVLSTYGLDGTAIGTSPAVVTVYLRKVAEGGTRVADATAEHISFVINEGMILPRGAGGTGSTPNDADLTIVPVDDGSNAIMVIDTAVAIT